MRWSAVIGRERQQPLKSTPLPLQSAALQNAIGLINSLEALGEKGPLAECGCILI